MTTEKILNAVNLAGSIASITGVSLLWLKSATGGPIRMELAVPVYLALSVFVMGMLIGCYLLLATVAYWMEPFAEFVGGEKALRWFIYAFGGPILFIVVFLIGGGLTTMAQRFVQDPAAMGFPM